MTRKYSIRKDQEDFRKIVLNRKISHWQKANKLFPEHEDVKRMTTHLREHNIKEPYATNIAMRLFYAAWQVIEKTK